MPCRCFEQALYNERQVRSQFGSFDGDRPVRSLFVLVVACALLAPPLAHARDWGAGFRPQLQAQGLQPGKKDPGQHPRGDREKRPMPDKDHRGRLTQEERRELHRDLDRANREIYRK